MTFNQATLAALEARLEHLTDLAADLNKAVLEAHKAFQDAKSSNEPLKDEIGKLTTLGLLRMNLMMDQGKSNSEIATYFNVSPSAVTYHRKKIEANRHSNNRLSRLIEHVENTRARPKNY